MPIKAFRTFARMLARESENHSDMQLLRRYAASGLMWLILTEIVLVASDYPASLLVGVLVAGTHGQFVLGLSQIEAVYAIAGMALASKLTLALIHMKMSYQRNSFEHKLWDLMMKTGSRHLVRLDSEWHNEHGTGEKESILDKNYGWLWNLIDTLVFGIVPDLVRDALIAGGLFFVNWRFAVLAIGLTTTYMLVVQINGRRLAAMSEHYRAEMKAANVYSSQTTDAVHEIKSRGLDEHRYAHLSGLTNRLYTSELTRHTEWMRVLLRQDIVLSMGAVATMLVAYSSYQHGTAIGGIVLGLGWNARIVTNLFRLTDLQHALNRGGPALLELNKFFQTEAKIVTPENAEFPARLAGGIEFQQVSFGYPGKEDHQIKDVSFNIAPKSFVAFVGQTGSGKSTIIALLQRLYDVCVGSIAVDGVDVRRLDLSWLRGTALSVVSQNPRLFDGTIHENIALGRQDASEDEIHEAARQACVTADDFAGKVSEFPLGLQTLIGENGIKLSGGQKSRVALARAILARSAVLVLDEATASLDNTTEKAIQHELDTLTSGTTDERPCTVIAIAHRLTTVRRADVIHAMKDGRIVESGTHEELIAREGYYYQLWQSGSM